MTYEEFLEYDDLHSDCEDKQVEWYEYDESEYGDNAGMCPECNPARNFPRGITCTVH